MEEAQGCQTTNGNCHRGDGKFKENMPLSPPGQGARGIPVLAEAAHKGRAIKTRTWDRTQKSKCGVSSSFVISVSWETR